MLTGWAIIISIFPLFFFGLPVVLWLTDFDDSAGHANPIFQWCLVPLVGLSVIILVLQNLVYLNVPLRYSVGWFWVAGGIMWGILLLRKRELTWIFLKSFPGKLFLVAVFVYSVHSLGLFLLGARYYVGRAWIDQFNYTMTAHYLMNFRVHYHNLHDVIEHPFLFSALSKTSSRIGEVIYQGFVALSGDFDAKIAFEAAILVFPPLVAWVIYLLGHFIGFSKRLSLWVALVSAGLPAVAYIHLECFFSQALCIPFLLVWPMIVSYATQSFYFKRIILAALLFSAAVSIYTEFLMFFLGISIVVILGDYVIERKALILKILMVLLMMIISVALNPAYIHSFYDFFGEVVSKNILVGIYPWAIQLEGVSRLWLGDFVQYGGMRYFSGVVNGISVCLLVLSYVGLLGLWMKKRGGVSLGVLALSLCMIPLFISGINLYPYQFYKILLSIAPLYPVGIVVFLSFVFCRMTPSKIFFYVKGFLIILSALPLLAVGDLTWRTGFVNQVNQSGRGGAFKLINPITIQLQDKLENIQGENVVINWNDDFFNGAFVNGWLTYFARENKIWLGNFAISDGSVSQYLLKNPRLPSDFYYLSSKPISQQSLNEGGVSSVWIQPPYYLYRVDHFKGFFNDIDNVKSSS